MGELLIDVSEWNGKIDWKKVKESGINYAILRVGGRYANSGIIYDDDRFIENIIACNEYDIKVGAYFFTQAITPDEAIEEATYCINKLRGYKIELPVYIDVEYLEGGRHNNISYTLRTKIIKTFTNTIKAAGYGSGVYSSLSWLNKFDIKSLKDISLWVAQYYDKCECPYPYDIWQYTSIGIVDGIIGDVDKNVLYIQHSYSDEVKIKAVDVLLDNYGTGEERKKKLGNDYEKVQKLVNELYERMKES